jgi:hypothetical protein
MNSQDNRTGSRRWNTGPYEILAVGTDDIRELWYTIYSTVFSYIKSGSHDIAEKMLKVITTTNTLINIGERW